VAEKVARPNYTSLTSRTVKKLKGDTRERKELRTCSFLCLSRKGGEGYSLKKEGKKRKSEARPVITMFFRGGGKRGVIRGVKWRKGGYDASQFTLAVR